MKTRKVINPKCLPISVQARISRAMVLFLVLDKMAAPIWVWFIFGTAYVLTWIAYLNQIHSGKLTEVDIFEEDDDE